MSQHSMQAARFASIINALDPERSMLDRFCEASRELLGAEGASITVYYDAQERHTVSSTSSEALVIEQAQEVVGEGPGFDAARTGEIVVGDFSARGTPWMALEGSLARLGFSGSVLALPIAARVRRLGVLVAHVNQPQRTFDDGAARYLASALGPVLLDHVGPEALEAELTEDWSSRAVIHQATGMVIVDLRVPPSDALTLLRAHAYATDSTLFEVATHVVSGDLTFDNLSMEGDR